MRIGQVAERTGVPERLLRYYEDRDLLTPARTAGGYREYSECDVETVAKVRSLLAGGLSTATIAELLPCLDDREGVFVPTCPETRARLASERQRLSAGIAELRAARGVLDEMLASVDPR